MKKNDTKNLGCDESTRTRDQINEWRKQHGLPPMGIAFVEENISSAAQNFSKEKDQFKGKEI